MSSALAGYIDHTNLKPEADAKAIDTLCAEAKQHGFAAVCVNSRFVGPCAEALRGTPTAVCAVAGFPLGAMKPMARNVEATGACKDGAREIDFVAHLPDVLRADYDALHAEFIDLVRTVRSVNPDVVVKVILETAALLADGDMIAAEQRIESACRAAQESGCDFVKTSTGFHPAGGATFETVKLLRKYAGPLKVKAAGGIKSRDDAQRMIDAGADRLGCSAGVQIVQGEVASSEY